MPETVVGRCGQREVCKVGFELARLPTGGTQPRWPKRCLATWCRDLASEICQPGEPGGVCPITSRSPTLYLGPIVDPPLGLIAFPA